VSLSIRLLGAPRIERHGEPGVGPRGNKAWALLAYLALSRQAPSRRKLAELLFSEAADPLGALRWSLAQLRQTLQQPNAVKGDPVELALEPETRIDLRRLRAVGLPDPDELEALSCMYDAAPVEVINFKATMARYVRYTNKGAPGPLNGPTSWIAIHELDILCN
jgi:DNA-binding SARP family transcriptional activator